MLQAGSGVVDISPKKPVFLVGYPRVERISTGINDSLTASALYLKNKSTAIMMIAVDLLYLKAKTTNEIREKIALNSGLKADKIMISSTHTHSGPITVDTLAFRNDPVVPPVDPEYLVFIKERIIAAGLQAVREAKKAEVALTGVRVCEVGCNRHNPAGPRDSEVGVMAIRDFATKKIRSVSLIYCMHPTVLHEDSKLVSADFPGYTREYLKNIFGEELDILYHTGPEGNQSPRYCVKSQTFAEAKRLGYILGARVSEEIQKLSDRDFSQQIELVGLSTSIKPERRILPNLKEAEKNLEFRKAEFKRLKSELAGHGVLRTAECALFGAEESLFLAICQKNGELDQVLADYGELEIQLLKIKDTFIACFPGELFVEYSLEIKKRFPERVFAICLANGETQGYIVSDGASGYEADNSLFTENTGSLMLDACQDLREKIIGSVKISMKDYEKLK